MSEIKVNSVVNSTGDNDSGLDLSTNDQVIIKTANTTALTVDSSQNMTLAGSLTGTTATFTTADNTDTLTLKSTDADANTGPTLFMQRDSASPADGDSIGKISFVGDNDAGEAIRFARIDNQISDASDGTEDALMFITTMVGGTEVSRMTLQPTETVFNEESADLDFRVESNGNANMLFVDGGNDKVGIGNNNPNDFGSLASDLVIGTTSGEHGLTIVTGTANSARMQFADNTSSPFRGAIEYGHSADAFFFYCAGNFRMKIDTSGNVTNSTGSYGTISDEELKENISDASSQWNDIKALQVRKYSMKEDDLDSADKIGVIAQELETSGMNGLVEETEWNGETVKSVKYSILYMKAVKALQEAMTRIETLEAKVTALESA